VDSLWLKKENTSEQEYHDLCRQIEAGLNLPISFEGVYKWIVFLNSKSDPRVPVLNRYYGVFQDGTLKVRGIDLRRHDTAGIVRDCQGEILNLLSHASNSAEFRKLIPQALMIAKKYIRLIRDGQVPAEKLVLEKRLSKPPEEYRSLSHQAIAAQQLQREGRYIHAGQNIRYVVIRDKAPIQVERAVPAELFEAAVGYDTEAYVKLLKRSVTTLFLPFDCED
jgi:DNA polymerase elongation subunit (family B)